jgi:hypothetical protein
LTDVLAAWAGGSRSITAAAEQSEAFVDPRRIETKCGYGSLVTTPEDEADERNRRIRAVIRTAQDVLGDERYGGAWVDDTYPSHAVIGIGVVGPSQSDVERIAMAAKEAGWFVELVSVRYPRVRLVSMLEEIREKLPGDAWNGLGWDPRLNSVVADLNRWDEEAVAWAKERFPADALVIRIQPGRRWNASTLNSR